MHVCGVHFIKGFAIWAGSDVVYGQFNTGYSNTSFTIFLKELRDQNASMSKGEIISEFQKKYGNSVTFSSVQPSPCDTFQF